MRNKPTSDLEGPKDKKASSCLPACLFLFLFEVEDQNSQNNEAKLGDQSVSQLARASRGTHIFYTTEASSCNAMEEAVSFSGCLACIWFTEFMEEEKSAQIFRLHVYIYIFHFVRACILYTTTSIQARRFHYYY